MIDVYQLAAEKFHGVPTGWQWCSLDMHNAPLGHIKVEGGVPVGTYRSGKRKGQPKFPKERQTIWVTVDQTKDVTADWEKKTGKCYRCEGSGKEIQSTSVIHGRTYRECSRCKGTGKASNAS